MNSSSPPARHAAPPPIGIARLGGAMYVIIIVLGMWAELFVRQRLSGAGDLLTMAATIRANEGLWRAGVAAELVSLVCVGVLALTWLTLLRPVNRDLTLLAMVFVITAHAISAIASVQTLSALFPLAGSAWLDVFSPEQLAALARLTQRDRDHLFSVSLLLTGCFFVIAGPLIYRSGYLPKVVGALYTLAGVAYIINTFSLVLAPAIAGTVFMIAGPLILAGEGTLSLYLLIKGVQVEGWNRRQAELAANPK